MRHRSTELCRQAFGEPYPRDVREITWLAVRPSHQRQGLGGRLLAELRAQATADDKLLTVYTSPESHVAFYQRAGFEVRAAIRPAHDMHTRLLVAMRI